MLTNVDKDRSDAKYLQQKLNWNWGGWIRWHFSSYIGYGSRREFASGAFI